MAESAVYVRLTSGLNISFDHTMDTGYTLDEWRMMGPEEQFEAVSTILWENVEAGVVDEDGEYI